MVPGLIRRYSDEISVVNAHLNELPVKFSVCVIEGQDKLPTMYWLPKLHKIKIKLRSFKSNQHINEKRDGSYRGFGYFSFFSDP